MKMSMKKRVLMFAMVAVSAVFAYGQSAGDVAIGGNIAYTSSDGYSAMGLGVKMQWNVTDAIRLEPSTTFFTKNNGWNLWDVSFNGHYLFNLAERFYLYPIGGVCLTGASYEHGNIDSQTEIGFVAGGGAEFALTPQLSVNAELKYQFSSDWDRALFTTGIVYRF